jgi:hypothetical protein
VLFFVLKIPQLAAKDKKCLHLQIYSCSSANIAKDRRLHNTPKLTAVLRHSKRNQEDTPNLGGIPKIS